MWQIVFSSVLYGIDRPRELSLVVGMPIVLVGSVVWAYRDAVW